jgi:hypothetical protein
VPSRPEEQASHKVTSTAAGEVAAVKGRVGTGRWVMDKVL